MNNLKMSKRTQTLLMLTNCLPSQLKHLGPPQPGHKPRQGIHRAPTPSPGLMSSDPLANRRASCATKEPFKVLELFN